MPYSSISDAPANIRELDGAKLTLSQINWIAKVADGIPEGQTDEPWAVAIAQFKKAYMKQDNKWMKRKDEMNYIGGEVIDLGTKNGVSRFKKEENEIEKSAPKKRFQIN